MPTRAGSFGIIAAAAALALANTSCHRHKHAAPDLSASQQPDQVLYEKAMEDIKNKRLEVARLTLQTLINAYPDSDYLERAKLAIADSRYHEGGSAGLAHAEAEYKDFITFFPNSPHAAYAQYQAAMTRYRQLEKPDRDHTDARRTEQELQLLLKNFPESEYAREGALKLKEVQELLAEREFRIARFYFIKQSYGAAASRLEELAARYPNFSRSDAVLWMVARSLERKPLPNPERAALYYTRLVSEHPWSEHGEDAQERLLALSKPVPEPTAEALARAEKEWELRAQYAKGFTSRFWGMFSSKPDLSAAHTRLGAPVLDTRERKPPPASAEEVEAQRQILVERLGANNPTEASTDAANDAEAKKPQNKKKSLWRKLVPLP